MGSTMRLTNNEMKTNYGNTNKWLLMEAIQSVLGQAHKGSSDVKHVCKLSTLLITWGIGITTQHESELEKARLICTKKQIKRKLQLYRDLAGTEAVSKPNSHYYANHVLLDSISLSAPTEKLV